MEYYILRRYGKVEYKGKEWSNLVAFVQARKSKEGYTLSSFSIQGGRALISHVFDLETFFKPSTKIYSTTVDMPLRDLEMLVKEAKEIGVCNIKSHFFCDGGYEGR